MSSLIDRRIISPQYGESPATSTVSSSDQLSFRRELAFLDHELDFATATESNLQNLHLSRLVNTARRDPERRATVERFLSSLRIVYNDEYQHGDWCSLDSAANQILLKVEFHNALDYSGEFLIVGALDCLQQARDELVRANAAWDNECQVDNRALRKINFRLPCFTDTHFEILIMQASLGRKHVFDSRVFAHDGIRRPYMIDVEAEILVPVDNADPPLTPFAAAHTDRLPSQRVNLLLLTINNASRFRAHHLDPGRSPITNARSLEIKRLIMDLEDLIVYLPDQHIPFEPGSKEEATDRNLGRISDEQKHKRRSDLPASTPVDSSRRKAPAQTKSMRPDVAAFYAALPQPGEKLEKLGTLLEMPEPPISIDLDIEEVEALRAKQDLDWEREMQRS